MSGNPSTFNPTGKGWFNQLPNLVADQTNSSGMFRLNALDRTLYLFITGVTQGLTLSGDNAQSKAHRTFYPLHLHQDEIVIEGICANQYQYDKLVDFVVTHQRNVIQDAKHVVNFKLFPYRIALGQDEKGNPTAPYRWIVRPMHLEGVIESIDAGAERFKNVKTWAVSLKVTNDFLLKGKPETEVAIDTVLKRQYERIFGALFSEKPVPQGTQNPGADDPNAEVDITDDVDFASFKIAGMGPNA